ncbi:MAG TPA: SGNH/GDSL hydrolase family protein [Paucimonas sp.]|nr:SGNH/GDSL hydrolase family protein [Paucimonas sp.]
MRHLLPELVALPLYPLLLAQGRRTRRITPRLPEAVAPYDGIAGAQHAGAPLSLLTVGESPVAGVGVGTHEEAITGQFALALARHVRRPVAWRACGKNGVTVRQAIEQVLPEVPPQSVDIALVAFGVNDTTAFHSVARWRNDLRALLRALDERCQPRAILLSGVPPVGAFPALPQPLRWVMGMKARALDRAARELARDMPRTHYVALALDTSDRDMMASDGYHPSHKGCAAWAALLAEHYRSQRFA